MGCLRGWPSLLLLTISATIALNVSVLKLIEFTEKDQVEEEALEESRYGTGPSEGCWRLIASSNVAPFLCGVFALFHTAYGNDTASRPLSTIMNDLETNSPCSRSKDTSAVVMGLPNEWILVGCMNDATRQLVPSLLDQGLSSLKAFRVRHGLIRHRPCGGEEEEEKCTLTTKMHGKRLMMEDYSCCCVHPDCATIILVQSALRSPFPLLRFNVALDGESMARLLAAGAASTPIHNEEIIGEGSIRILVPVVEEASSSWFSSILICLPFLLVFVVIFLLCGVESCWKA